jgi:hypothetical protein
MWVYVADRGLAAMNERRGYSPAGRALERYLSVDQVVALRDFERFGWELKFVRRPPFQPPLPVMFDSDRKHYAVIRVDGSLDEAAQLQIR